MTGRAAFSSVSKSAASNLSSFIRVLDRILDFMVVIIGVLFAFDMFITVAEVILRRLGRPIPGMTEMTEHTLLLVTFLGMAWLVREGGHVSVDIFLPYVGRKARIVFAYMTDVIGTVGGLYLTMFGGIVTVDAFQRHLYFPTILRLPQWPFYAVIPIGGVLLLAEYLVRLATKVGSRAELQNVLEKDDL
ncbi:MAG: TRAP transporter small permease [Chloroflexi bacterium]|nr:TRAP transporter small permease [Chloroflexota bacterium]